VAERIVKADVASLYPSLMRQYGIGPARDRLGVLLALVDGLVSQRLAAKARGKAAPPGSSERYTQEAIAAAMKILVNSAYGYMGASGLTRFSDVHAANEVTRRGRELLAMLCRELAARGVTLLEADTDGVYFAVPPTFEESDERRVVQELGALLPERVKLEFDGRYAAMLSHEPKNYALLGYDGKLSLRGVAFHSSRSEPFGERFLRLALEHLLRGDVAGVREVYLQTADALKRRALPVRDVSSRVRLTKTPEEYLATREQRRELAYDALLGAGVERWTVGERVHVYRRAGKRAALLAAEAWDDDELSAALPRDYDVDYYLRLLRDTFASRLERALSAEHYAAVFADPDQLTMFGPSLHAARPILSVLSEAQLAEDA
jgi:DNA polymerase elongation subunit (family B)